MDGAEDQEMGVKAPAASLLVLKKARSPKMGEGGVGGRGMKGEG